MCTARFQYLIRFILFTPRTDQVLSKYLSSPDNYSERNNWYNDKIQIQFISSKYKTFLAFFEFMKPVEDRCFLVEKRIISNEIATARIELLKNGIVIERDFAPPEKINAPQNISISWDRIDFTIEYNRDSVTTHIRVEYSEISKINSNTNYSDENQISVPIDEDSKTLVSLTNLKSKDIYLIKISVGSTLGYGPTTEITVETGYKEGKLN